MNTSLKLDMNNHLIIWLHMTKTLNAIPGFYLFVWIGVIFFIFFLRGGVSYLRIAYSFGDVTIPMKCCKCRPLLGAHGH